jgi:hypothetical protein
MATEISYSDILGKLISAKSTISWQRLIEWNILQRLQYSPDLRVTNRLR